MSLNTENSTKWGVLFCPSQNIWNSDKRYKEIKELLDSNDVMYDIFTAETSDRVQYVSKMCINNNYKTIVIVGGDHALNDFINVLFSYENDIIKTISFSIIPDGVMNDFAFFWDAKEKDEDNIIKSIKKNRVRKIDVGLLQYTNGKGEACRRYFLNSINIGSIAYVMGIKSKMNNIFSSRFFSFLLSFFFLLFKSFEYKMSLKTDQEDMPNKFMALCIGNCRGYGQTPNAVPYNGTLDVSLVTKEKVSQLFKGIYLFIRGKLLNYKHISVYRTTKVEIEEIVKAPITIDGRSMKLPMSKVMITIKKEIVNFIIPKIL